MDRKGGFMKAFKPTADRVIVAVTSATLTLILTPQVIIVGLGVNNKKPY
jgi:hypothetical protein